MSGAEATGDGRGGGEMGVLRVEVLLCNCDRRACREVHMARVSLGTPNMEGHRHGKLLQADRVYSIVHMLCLTSQYHRTTLRHLSSC